MNINKKNRIERELVITETDMVNGGEVLILIAYATKEDDELWSYPTPQIFAKELYEKNKAVYDSKVIEFRSESDLL